jgi:hypothetical protein
MNWFYNDDKIMVNGNFHECIALLSLSPYFITATFPFCYVNERGEGK